MDTCPCGAPGDLQTHCGPIHAGIAPAPTAEALMRARYAAYATGAIDFILDSIHPDHLEGHDRDSIQEWSAESEWLGLEILSTAAGGENDDEGEVEFIARYRADQQDPVVHHERAQFARRDGQWYFTDGQGVEQGTVVRDAPKVGRNDPCPCGSGKKYKKCCAVATA